MKKQVLYVDSPLWCLAIDVNRLMKSRYGMWQQRLSKHQRGHPFCDHTCPVYEVLQDKVATYLNRRDRARAVVASMKPRVRMGVGGVLGRMEKTWHDPLTFPLVMTTGYGHIYGGRRRKES